MAVPDFQSLMLPILRLVASKPEAVPIRAAIDHLAEAFHLTDEDRRELLPSGKQSRFDNRVHWACAHLRKAILLDSPRRAHIRVTQAKRWGDRPVGRPEVQQFAGGLAGHGAGKGILLTTSHFTKEAREYASGLRNAKIVLIDGDELAELMIDHDLGVATAASYEVKRIDLDYFTEGEE